MQRALAIAAGLIACWAPGLALADGLSDLKSALEREQGAAEVKGALTVRFKHTHGEGKDASQEAGSVALHVEDGPAGLRLTYSRETLARLDAEMLAKERDKDAKAPTLPAVDILRYRDIRGMTAAGNLLARLLERCKFIAEKTGDWNGTPARVLSFDLGLPPEVDDKQRQYIKQHTGELTVWIGADGVPLASRTHDAVNGRAFLFLTFEIGNDESATFARVGDRLVALKRETRRSARQSSDVQRFDVDLSFQPEETAKP